MYFLEKKRRKTKQVFQLKSFCGQGMPFYSHALFSPHVRTTLSKTRTGKTCTVLYTCVQYTLYACVLLMHVLMQQLMPMELQ